MHMKTQDDEIASSFNWPDTRKSSMLLVLRKNGFYFNRTAHDEYAKWLNANRPWVSPNLSNYSNTRFRIPKMLCRQHLQINTTGNTCRSLYSENYILKCVITNYTTYIPQQNNTSKTQKKTLCYNITYHKETCYECYNYYYKTYKSIYSMKYTEYISFHIILSSSPV